MTSNFKKNKAKLGLLIDIDMLLMVEKGIRGEICDSINMQQLATKIHKRL